MDNYQTAVLGLLADLIHEQQKTRTAITDLAEALAGVRKTVVDDAPAAETPTPETVEERTLVIADLRKAFAAQSKAGKKEELKALLAEFGAVKLPEVNAENYPELLRKAEAL
jgi:hypothetical protein